MIGRLARFRKTAEQPVAEPLPEDRQQLAIHAKRLLDDPVLTEAFERVEKDLIRQFLNSAVGETEKREAAYRLHWAKEQVRAKLRSMAAHAAVEQARTAGQ